MAFFGRSLEETTYVWMNMKKSDQPKLMIRNFRARRMHAFTRSYHLVIHFLLCSLLPVAAAPVPDESSPSKPNIIFVVADDMGFKDTGHSGNPIAKTPHLDRMAAEGLRFDNFYSAGGTCSPGRMAILTGRTPMRARMTTTVGAMQEGELTVAAALKTVGYETGHFGKWGLGREGTHPLKVGFDEAVWSKNYYDLGAAFFVGDSDKRDEAPYPNRQSDKALRCRSRRPLLQRARSECLHPQDARPQIAMPLPRCILSSWVLAWLGLLTCFIGHITLFIGHDFNCATRFVWGKSS